MSRANQVLSLIRSHPMYRWGIRDGIVIGIFAGLAIAILLEIALKW